MTGIDDDTVNFPLFLLESELAIDIIRKSRRDPQIRVGFDADLVLLDDAFRVRKTWVAGNLVFDADLVLRFGREPGVDRRTLHAFIRRCAV